MIEWNVDPVIFTLGPLSPRWYGLLFAAAFIVSYWILRRVFRVEDRPLQDLDALAIYMIVATIVGARLGHVLFYEPQIVVQDPLEVLAVWHGGLASHGGAIGIIIALWLFHRKYPAYSFIWLLDRLAIVAAISGAFIRIGNLMNSEIVGRVTDGTWGIWFTALDTVPTYRHPTQIYEALLSIGVFALLWWRYQAGDAKRLPGRLIGLFLILLFTGRFIIEFYKEHQEAFESSLPLDMGQLLSIPFVVAGIVILILGARKESAT